MITGTLKADGIAVMEISDISFLAGTANTKMIAKVAYVNSKTGATLGSFPHQCWSKPTLDALQALRTAMEQDIAQLYFDKSKAAGVAAGQKKTGGLGAFLGEPDAPSV